MTKLFLHIGYPKTGTTSIQRFLWKNRELLRSLRVLYPDTGIYRAIHYEFHKCLGYGEDHSDIKARPKQDLLESLRREVDACSPHAVIMSSEHFIRVPPTAVRELFSDFDTTIVVYLRRHDLLLDSLYMQRYKSGALKSFFPIDQFIASYSKPDSKFPLDFLKALDALAEVFGHDKIVVRPYERAQNTPDLCHDFLNALGLEWNEALKIPPREANPSVSNEVLCAMAAVQMSDASDAMKRIATVNLVKLDNLSPIGTKTSRMTYEQRIQLLERFAPSYRIIASKYLGRNGELFFDPLPTPDDHPTPPDVSQKQILSLILRALEPEVLSHDPKVGRRTDFRLARPARLARP